MLVDFWLLARAQSWRLSAVVELSFDKVVGYLFIDSLSLVTH